MLLFIKLHFVISRKVSIPILISVIEIPASRCLISLPSNLAMMYRLIGGQCFISNTGYSNGYM